MSNSTRSQELQVKKEQTENDKKKLRKILQPRDTIYVVYGNWGNLNRKNRMG